MDFVGTISREILSISWYWWIVIAGLILAVWRGRKERIVDSLIAGYVALILVITVLDREIIVNSYGRIKPVPFWSYGIPELKSEIICNYLLFLPLGVLLTLKNLDWKRVWLIGAAVSLGIETSQLIFSRGLFEFDDVIGNSVGCLLGAVIAYGYRRVKAK